MNHWAVGGLTTCGVSRIWNQGTAIWHSWVDITSLSTAVVSGFGVHTDTFLVAAIEPFLSLSVSLSVVHTDLERRGSCVWVGHAWAGSHLPWFGGGGSCLDGTVHRLAAGIVGVLGHSTVRRYLWVPCTPLCTFVSSCLLVDTFTLELAAILPSLSL